MKTVIDLTAELLDLRATRLGGTAQLYAYLTDCCCCCTTCVNVFLGC